jgi:hypothetical protein
MPSIDHSNWHVTYYWSASSGLRLGPCDYQSIRVLHDAAVPFLYVNYAGNAFGPFTDELQSTSADVEVREIMHGFDLKVTYDLYGPDYQYDHVWRFHHDGQFGSTIVIQGPGEEINGQHTYHVPFRFDLDLSGASGDSFQRWLDPGGWTDVAQEGQAPPTVSASPHFDWRLIDKGSDKGALVRARVGDDGELWALHYKPLESWSSWGATGASPPGSPGSVPALYASGESVRNTDIVVWYIAHISALERVTACGPWFKLEGFPKPEEPDGDGHDHDH